MILIRLFIQKGGYVGQLERTNQQQRRIEELESKSVEMQKTTLILTYVLAAGTTIAGLYQLVKGILWIWANCWFC